VRANGSGSTRARACISSEQSKSIFHQQFINLALAGEAGLLLLAWGLAGWLQVSPGQYLRLSLGNVAWGLLATVPLLLVLGWMLRSTASPVRNLVNLVTEEVGPLVARCTLLQLGCLAAVAGISEELLFRGVLQPALGRWLPQSAALVLASLIFGVVHAASRVYALFAALMGLYLGAVFLLRSSLIPPILAHGLYDFLALGMVAARYRSSQS
jgi:membrane protease YdiL (CAAX protease family)